MKASFALVPALALLLAFDSTSYGQGKPGPYMQEGAVSYAHERPEIHELQFNLITGNGPLHVTYSVTKSSISSTDLRLEMISFSSAKLKDRTIMRGDEITGGYPDTFALEGEAWHPQMPPELHTEVLPEYRSALIIARRAANIRWGKI